jgi:hypothetical protein
VLMDIEMSDAHGNPSRFSVTLVTP